MNLAHPMQQFQDWFTQQWVILWGTKINPMNYPWLIAPFGNKNGIGEDFIHQLAAKENLIVQRNLKSQGLIQSIEELNLSADALLKLSKQVIDFYENTSNYQLRLTVKWNAFFKFPGILVNRLFSHRINQLNISIENAKDPNHIQSEIITLVDRTTQSVKYTIWLRTDTVTNRVMYSGIYGSCVLPSGQSCIKAVFPLPYGNATVIMMPRVGEKGELILTSSGKKIGDAGFYFQLNDSKGNHWIQFIRSFRDTLVVSACEDVVTAEQTLTLWKCKVVQLGYMIEEKKQTVLNK